MDIATVARRTGVPASTLRYYEEKGLISSIGRSGLRRQYRPDVEERLALISLGRAAGLSLDEIARLFTADGRISIDRQMLTDKAEQIDKTIRQLTTMREGLLHAAKCPAPSHMECPRFRRLLGFAAAGTQRRPRTKRSRHEK